MDPNHTLLRSLSLRARSAGQYWQSSNLIASEGAPIQHLSVPITDICELPKPLARGNHVTRVFFPGHRHDERNRFGIPKRLTVRFMGCRHEGGGIMGWPSEQRYR